MSSSDTIENSEEKEKVLSNQTFHYAYPSNPKEIIKAFRSLKKPQIIKLSISCIIIILFGIFNNIQIIGNPIPENNCYVDVVHDWFKPLNYYFRGNKAFSSFLCIFGSLSIDILFLISYYSWAIYSIDWRYGINTMLFYGARYILNETARLRLPDLLYFPYPGFPSIVVGYIQGSDFFFSGHCGFPIVCMMEFIWLKKFWIAGYAIFVTCIEMIMMEACREHYTIDLIVGIIFAHYISIIGRDWVKFFYDKIKFLDRLKTINRQELKRIKFDWDIGD
jgi:hypothetical protein